VVAASHPNHPGYKAGRQIVAGNAPGPAVMEAASAILSLAARSGVEMPLTQAVAAIAAGKLQPRLAMDMLMRREAKDEE
jgi:glycerol-3-phosphate dehydrogenase